MAQNYKQLHIDSTLRDYGTSNSFRIKIEPALRELKSARLIALNLPVTNYNINSANNIIYVNNGVTTSNAVITPGIYTATTILVAIKAAIEATGVGGTITATFSDLTYRVTIAGTVAFSLAFSNILNSSAHILGFPNVNTSSSTSHEGSYAINLSVPPCVFIRIDEFPVMCKSTNGVNGTYPVYLNTISGEISFHFDNTHYHNETSSTVSNINMLNVTLVDPRDGTLFDLNGNDWAMLLELV